MKILFCFSSIFLLVHNFFQMHHGNIMDLFLLIICGIFATATVFIACELSQRLIDAFDKIHLNIDRCAWYLFPKEIKRILPIVIVYAQEPVSLECFGSLICNRDVFKNVIHRAFTCFMLLRQFSYIAPPNF